MGEGAGALVLEEEEHAKRRGVPILAKLSGFGMTTDAEHLTRPHPEGKGLALAIRRALGRAGIGAEQIAYLNPHATSTPQGDLAEINADGIKGERMAERNEFVGTLSRHNTGQPSNFEHIALG